MIKHIFSIPLFLFFIIAIGFLALPITVLSIINGELVSRYIENKTLIISPISFGLIILCAISMLLSSILMIKKKKLSKLIFLIGFVLIGISPVFVSLDIFYTEIFIIEFSFHLLITLTLSLYLFKSKEVKKYFV